MSTQPRSAIWESFRKLGDDTVQCMLCDRKLAHKYGTSNMHKHMRSQHSARPILKYCPKKSVKQRRIESSDDEDSRAAAHLEGTSGSPSKKNNGKVTGKMISVVWQHFDPMGEFMAKCRRCGKCLSYKGGTTGNLRKHMENSHTTKLGLEKISALDRTVKRPVNELVDNETVTEAKHHESATEEDYRNIVEALNEPSQITNEILIEEVVFPEHMDQASDQHVDLKPNIHNTAGGNNMYADSEGEPNEETSAYEDENPKKKSLVWRFFRSIPGSTYMRCVLCSTRMSNPDGRRSSSNFRKHLYLKHGHVMTGPRVRYTSDEKSLLTKSGRTQIMRNSRKPEADEEGDADTLAFSDKDDFDELPPIEEVNAPQYTIGHIEPDVQSLPVSDGRYSFGDHSGTAVQPTSTVVASVPSTTTVVPIRSPFDAALLHLLCNDMTFETPQPGFVRPFPTNASREHLTAKYHAVVKRVAALLQKADFVALTAATWTQTDKSSTYLAITAHFITYPDWRLHTVLLNCGRLLTNATDPISASAVTIADHLRQTCAFWRITDKVFAIVSQSGTRTDDGYDEEDDDDFGEAAVGWSRLQCLDRRMGDCIRIGLEVNEFEGLRLKLKSIVDLFATNDEAADKFQYFQRQSNPTAEPQQLLNDEFNLWRSTYRMLQRMCDLQEAVDASLEMMRHETRLSIGEWMAMRDVRSLLQTFDSALNELRSSTAVSTSKTIVVLHGMNTQLAAHRCSLYRSQVSKQLADQLQQTVRDRMSTSENDLLLAVCTFLDPRFKQCGFVRKQALNLCTMHVETLVSRVRLPEDADKPDEPLDADSVWNWLDEQVHEQHRSAPAADEAARREMKFFTEMLAIDRRDDPLQWWRLHGSPACPRMAVVARKYLALPATCAASRRALATAEQLITNSAAWMMDGAMVKKVLFLRENLNLFD